jgi:hypothetical protein
MEVSCAFPTALDSPDNIALPSAWGMPERGSTTRRSKDRTYG